jgi:glycosyltransferase involved in cell wall biosynthesis
MKSQKICFVLLALNEEKSIAAVITELQENIQTEGLLNSEIVLVDDSSDQTAAIARSFGVTIVPGERQGLGRAYFAGVKSCLELGAEIIVTLDSDGQVDLREVGRFLRALEELDADLILASRFLQADLIHYRYPLINRCGVRLLASFLSLALGQRITDSHGGIRAMRRPVAQMLRMTGRHTYVQEATIDAKLNGFRIQEIPSAWRARDFDDSRVVKSVVRYARKTLPTLCTRGWELLRFRLGGI